MRITTHQSIELNSPLDRRAILGQGSRPRLMATFILVISISLAWAIIAQPEAVGQSATDVRFADRLHDRVDWCAGLEFPLFDDSITCPFETAADSAARIAQPKSEDFDLEQEILRSVCEVFHVDSCEAFASIWRPADIAAQPDSDEGILIRAADVAAAANFVYGRTVDAGILIRKGCHQISQESQDWIAKAEEFESEFVAMKAVEATEAKTCESINVLAPASAIPYLIPPKYPTLGWPQPELRCEIGKTPKLETELFWEVFSANWKSIGREIEVCVTNLIGLGNQNLAKAVEWNWLDSQVVRASDLAKSTWDQLVVLSEQPQVQPVPTASYIGLERAIYQVQEIVSRHFGQWQSSGRLIASGSERLVKLQNETFERVVLQQFDAILR
ncbi:MAG: hypothetical protein Q8M16_17640 [Pirellulaceae bacterium]|nr:hypothetical protein [Pirellulaceae bacterium]